MDKCAASAGEPAPQLTLLFSGPQDLADTWGTLHFAVTPVRLIREVEESPFNPIGCFPLTEGTWEVFGQELKELGRDKASQEETNAWKIIRATTSDGLVFDQQATVLEEAVGPWTQHATIAFNPDAKEYLLLKLKMDSYGFAYTAFFSPDGKRWQAHPGKPLFHEGDAMTVFWRISHIEGKELDQEQSEDLEILARRVVLALRDRRRQEQLFSNLETLAPQVEMIQRLRAAARYEGNQVLTTPDQPIEDTTVSQWVKDALTHYWGGPKLTQSPLLDLQIVQQTARLGKETPANALRSILRKAIYQTRPEGERRFTTEWLIYNVLEMKFLEGRKVREVAMRLAMSEADLYRKQRVAIEAVAEAIVEMEMTARKERPVQPAGENPAGGNEKA